MKFFVMLLQSIAAVKDPAAKITENLAQEMLTLNMLS